MSSMLSIILIVLFSVVVAFLSASEIAVTMASRFRLYQLSKRGVKKATLLLSLQEHTHTLISTIIFINTCLFAGMTTLFTNMVNKNLGEWQLLAASLVMGAFVTFYLEVLPKVYAYQCPEKVGLVLAPIINGMRIFFRPVTRFMDAIAHKTLKLFGIAAAPPKGTTREDLMGAIDMQMDGNSVSAYEKTMLRSVLDLSNITVEEIMVHRKNIFSVAAHKPMKELAWEVFRSSYTRVPVWEGAPDNIIGVLNSKDLAKAYYNQEMTDWTSLVHAPWFIPNTTTVFNQLQLFKEKCSHQAFVVDEYGVLMGMVTLEDILEEIVGEIVDEHDLRLSGVRIDSLGNYIVQGSVSLRDLNRQYGWDFYEKTNASTLAGLILNHGRTIPDVGSILNIDGFHLKILRRQNHQITLVRVTPPSLDGESSEVGFGS